MTDEKRDLEKENTILRGLVAKHVPECIYCGSTGVCPVGYPGCNRMDDLMIAQCLSDDELLAANDKLTQQVGILTRGMRHACVAAYEGEPLSTIQDLLEFVASKAGVGLEVKS
jgi:hypothetical protein